MKKYIYKLSLLALAIFAFTGCNVDDDDPEFVTIKRTLEATLAQQSAIIAIPDADTSYDLVINFSEALPSYSSIEYSVDGVTASVTANTGDTSVSIPLDYGFGTNFHDVSIIGFHVVNADARNYIPTIGGVSDTRVIKQGFLAVTITWGDPSDDIDFGLQPMTATWVDTFAWIDTSLGVTSTEFLAGDMLADGNYAVFVQFFTAPADVIVTYAVQSAGGDFTFDLLTNQDGNILWFTKSTDGDGNVSYNFFTEDPS